MFHKHWHFVSESSSLKACCHQFSESNMILNSLSKKNQTNFHIDEEKHVKVKPNQSSINNCYALKKFGWLPIESTVKFVHHEDSLDTALSQDSMRTREKWSTALLLPIWRLSRSQVLLIKWSSQKGLTSVKAGWHSPPRGGHPSKFIPRLPQAKLRDITKITF